MGAHRAAGVSCGMGMYAGQITFQQPAVQGPQTTATQETTL
ncbi:hypothetical protein [Streptomyces sp. NBC_00354]